MSRSPTEDDAKARLIRFQGGLERLELGSPKWRLLESQETLHKMRTGICSALSVVLDLKDLGTGLHGTRLAEWAVRVAERLELPSQEVSNIELASLLHDVGKIGVPDEILSKPNRLSKEEFEVVKKHPEYGWAILRAIPGFETAAIFVLHHHERYDGNGYPAGLSGEDIPLGARIVAIFDAFDAMISSGSYREGLGWEEALRRLRKDAGTHFDPRIVSIFISLVQDEGASTSAPSLDDLDSLVPKELQAMINLSGGQ